MQCIYGSKYKTAVDGVCSGHGEGRHKTGRLVRASIEPIFWGAKWKVTCKNKKQDAILFLEAISLTNTKCHNGSQLHGLIQLMVYI